MINSFYSSINNGSQVSKCSNTQHYAAEQLYLLKDNFLGEFRTSLEKAKVRANLGIADSDTLYWGNIQGDIANQQDISEYINKLLAFDYNIEKGFDAGDNFQNITNVKQAAITCLDYLSKFKGEKAEIQELDSKIQKILLNLYAVKDIEQIENSGGGIINKLTTNVLALQEQLGNPKTSVQEIEEKLDQVEESINQVNNILKDINSLLVKYVPEDGTKNALEIIEDSEITESKPSLDDQGNQVYDEDGNPVYKQVITIKKGGLYVKDLQPQIDKLNNEINGELGKVSLLQDSVDLNTARSKKNESDIKTLNDETIPGINTEIDNIRENYVSKESLGGSSDIITMTTLNQALENYIQTDSSASLSEITSKNDSINISKPFNFTTNAPGDARRYVQTKNDLLTISQYWEGMEVIVIDEALLYILKKDGNPTDPTFSGWKLADSLSIEVLSQEEFESRKEAGKLNSSVYYYIYSNSDSVTFKECPVREDYATDEDFDYAYETWKKGGYILQGVYMSAAWGQDLDNRVKRKADKIELETLSNKVSKIEDTFSESSTEAINALRTEVWTIYKPAVTSPGEDEAPAQGLLVTLQDDINNLATTVNGIESRVEVLENTDFVTWDSLGGDGEELEDGKTLFVKTTTYEADKENNSQKFTSKILESEQLNTQTISADSIDFPKVTIVHHPAIDEVSHNATQEDVNKGLAETVGDKIIDVEAQEAYDEEIKDSLLLTRNNDRLKVGEDAIAFTDDLVKTVEFESYLIYYNWINNKGTIDGKEGSATYEQWASDKNIDDWYFIIKYDGSVLPQKESEETDEQYKRRIELLKKGMPITIYTAENIFASQTTTQSKLDTLDRRITLKGLEIDRIQNDINEQLISQNKQLQETLEDFRKQLQKAEDKIKELTAQLQEESNYSDQIVEVLQKLGKEHSISITLTRSNTKD